MRRIVLTIAVVLSPRSSCDGISPRSPRPDHVADQSRVVRHPHGGGVPVADVLNRGLLQERAVERGGPLPEARGSHLVDVESRNENDAGPLADSRLVRDGGIAANIVRREVGREAASYHPVRGDWPRRCVLRLALRHAVSGLCHGKQSLLVRRRALDSEDAARPAPVAPSEEGDARLLGQPSGPQTASSNPSSL